MTALPGLLPLLSLGLFTVAARSRAGHWTEAVVLGAIAWGTVVTVLTETLGAANAITFSALGMIWSAIALSLGAWIVRARALPAPGPALDSARRDPWLTLPIVLFAAVTLLIALAAPPNTFDSMAYHMSRVAQWAANGSVDNYPTAILRQLHMAPFAEYAMLHVYVLSGGDRLVNLVQWLAMVGSLAAAAAIARELGGGRAAMLIAAAFCATLPIGIMEATGTKNDYVVAFWVATVAWLALVLIRHPPAGEPRRREYWLALGAATGLAMLTKATAYLFIAPFLVWVAVALVRRFSRPSLANAAMAAVLALALNAAFFARNLELHGSPFGARIENEEHAYANERVDGAVLASNVLRNVALQVATGSRRIDGLITRAVRKAHRILGIDPALPATTWMSIEFDAHQRWRHEDSAPNPLHFVVVLAAPAALIGWRDRSTARGLAFFAAILAGFLLFCGYLQWQPWHSRLHLPLLVLGAPLAGLAIARIPWRGAAPGAAVLFAAAGAPALVGNESRELAAARNVLNTPRSLQYFANWTDIAGAYIRAARRIDASGCRDVALVGWWNGYEYPLWALTGGGVRLDHVAVENESGRYAKRRRPVRYCGVVALTRHELAADYADSLGLKRVIDDPSLMLFLAPPDER